MLLREKECKTFKLLRKNPIKSSGFSVLQVKTASGCNQIYRCRSISENRGTFKMVQDITFEARAEFPVFVQIITNQLLLRPTLEMVEIGGLVLRPVL